MDERQIAPMLEDEAAGLSSLKDRDVLLSIRDYVLAFKPIPKDLQEQWFRIKANQQEASWKNER